MESSGEGETTWIRFFVVGDFAWAVGNGRFWDLELRKPCGNHIADLQMVKTRENSPVFHNDKTIQLTKGE